MDDWTWIKWNRDDVLDISHPDYAHLIEADAIEPWAETGEPPGGWPETPAPPSPSSPKSVEVPAVALTVSRQQAAALLNISVDTFERRVLPGIRVVQIGARQVIPVRELERWVAENSARALKD
jgi:hypothetical protein